MKKKNNGRLTALAYTSLKPFKTSARAIRSEHKQRTLSQEDWTDIGKSRQKKITLVLMASTWW